ncbi:MAG: helix-turn-helix domain-containing protein [Gemmatimonadota bacterium]
MTTIPIDAYILDTLLPDLVGHDRMPSAALLYLHLFRRCYRAPEAGVQVSLTDLVLGTGLSKRSVQSALGLLTQRRLITVTRESATAIPHYALKRPWLRFGRRE